VTLRLPRLRPRRDHRNRSRISRRSRRRSSRPRPHPPPRPAQNGHGVVIARLTVARDGGLIDLSLSKQSGSAGVDGSVLEAIRRAAPFSPLPKTFADNRFTFIVPITFAPEQ
jgi:protein TonB